MNYELRQKMKEIEQQKEVSLKMIRETRIKLLQPNSTCVVCRGIADSDEHRKRLGYKWKHLQMWERPFTRMDSDNFQEFWGSTQNLSLQNHQQPSKQTFACSFNFLYAPDICPH